ncbi:MAG: CoB--CoM heterodisulfide reductase iron-sulfur subunit B family protein [Anaerolineaceae bacterium]
MTEYSYYPGCSLHSTAKEFGQSVQAVFTALDVRLNELPDWNCCSASSGHSLNPELSLALSGRNIAIAQQQRLDVVMPCAACFNRHKTAQHALRHQPEERRGVEQAAGFSFDDSIEIRAPLEVVVQQVGLEKVRGLVKNPLAGLKVVDYYGCLLVRPPEITGFENPDNPVYMKQIVSALGAEPVDWSYATDCCGGGLALTKPKTAARMVQRLADYAREAGAQAIVTSCPLCQLNLEMRQSGEPLPIFYFTELMGLAFGLTDTKNWWKLHLINPLHLLDQFNLAV